MENRIYAISKHVLLKIKEGKSAVGFTGLARVLAESEINNESGRKERSGC